MNCGKEFDIAAAKWCEHAAEDGHQSKVCPHCGKCICREESEGALNQFTLVELDPPIKGIGYTIWVKDEDIIDEGE